MDLQEKIQILADKANQNPITALRLKNWQKIIQWEVGEHSVFWTTEQGNIKLSKETTPDFVIRCSLAILERLVNHELPFFVGLWGTREIEFEGSFADAYKLGYIFLNDKRERRIVFISHCWLNMNTRFPEGSTFAGADLLIIKALLDEGLGLIQMPCPEYACLGLEKDLYGVVVGDELRTGFRKVAGEVVQQIKDYLALGYEIVGIIGMNPSPSCGVGIAKGKGTMLGLDRDTSEKEESGVFIDELQKILNENDIDNLPILGIRRPLERDNNNVERINDLRRALNLSR